MFHALSPSFMAPQSIFTIKSAPECRKVENLDCTERIAGRSQHATDQMRALYGPDNNIYLQ